MTRWVPMVCATLIGGAPLASAAPPEPVIKGALPKTVVAKQIRRSRRAIQRCFEKSLARDPSSSGKLSLTFVISADGVVEKVAITPADTDPKLAKCIRRVIEKMAFPKPAGGGIVEVSYPFTFSAAGDGAKREKVMETVGGAGVLGMIGSAGGGAGLGLRGRGVGSGAAGKARGSAGASGGKRRARISSKASGGGSGYGSSAPLVARKSAAPRVVLSAPAVMGGGHGMVDFGDDSVDGELGAGGGGAGAGGLRPSAAVAAPAMTAGRHDDNQQFNRFLAFLNENRGLIPYPVDVRERLAIAAIDRDGRSLANCRVRVETTGGEPLAESRTLADGHTHFFPTAQGPTRADAYRAVVTCGGETRRGQLTRGGQRRTELRFDQARAVPTRVPVDVAILLDTTGSMSSQIGRLMQTLQAIHLQLTQLPTQPDLRFALVAYRDRGDEYVTRVTGFTRDIGQYQRVLDGLRAEGGGDTPEDLQTALRRGTRDLQWRDDALRLGFVIADAAPHTDYNQKFTYRTAMQESLSRGIKWTTVGAGGLTRQGEVIFRQLAQYTMGEYVFVTQGGGDTDGGPAEASHHVGTNYRRENLDQAIVRIVRRELSHLTDEPRDFDDTIIARGPATAPRDDVLAPAVEEVLRQLTDYSALFLADETPAAVLPVSNADAELAAVAGYLTDQLTLVATRQPVFRVVERDLQAVVEEHALQLEDMFDVSRSVPLGQLLGAEVLIVTKLNRTADGAELYAKLVRVETGEILSAAKVRLAGGLLSSS